MVFFNFFRKKKTTKIAKSVNDFIPPNNLDTKLSQFQQYQQNETLIESRLDKDINANLNIEFDLFTKFLQADKKFNFALKSMLLKDQQNSSLSNLAKLLMQFGNKYIEFTQTILCEEQKDNEKDSRFLSLVQAIDLVFKIPLFNSNGDINLRAVYLVDFFLNDIFYDNLTSYKDKSIITADDIRQILSTHFSSLSVNEFIEQLIDPKYEVLESIIIEDQQLAIGKDINIFDQRLAFLLMVDLLRKTTFLPLSYHELIKHFLGEQLENPKEQMHFINLRRFVITYGKQMLQLLVTHYLVIKAYEYDLTGKSYYVDQNGVESFLKSISIQPLLLLVYLLLARRKANNPNIFLHEKDIELIESLSYQCETKVNYRNFYLYLKTLGL